MKKNLTLTLAIILAVALVNPARSQQTGKESPIAGRGVINFKKLADKELLSPVKQSKQVDNEEKEEAQRGIPYNLPVPAGTKVHQVTGNFITRLTANPASPLVASPAPLITFNGLLDNNAIIPPDVNGAAGPNHLFEVLNSQYRIFSKTGTTISTLSLATFWSGLSGSGSPYSDPHIVYDAPAGRWYACMIANLNNGHYGIFVAASLTNDPTGSWYEYSIDTGPSNILPDYPLLGYSKRFIVITTNDFNNFVYQQARITVLNKAKVVAGTLTSVKKFFDPALFTIAPAETMDANQNTEYLVSNYNGNSGGSGFLKVGTITGTANQPIYTAGTLIGVNQPWSDVTKDAPQSGSIKLINTGGTKMRSPIVRNGFIWATHTVYLPAVSATRAASDFWQINPATNAVVQYGRIDDPSAALWVSYPSLAVTANNDVLLGSTMVGSSIFASAIYAYRNGADAANTFRSNYTYQAGQASYFKDFGSGRNRWGDYSSTCIDPANGSFWTLQEFAKTPANTWATQWANVSPVALAGPVAVTDVSPKTVDLSVSLTPNPAKGAFNVNYQSTKTGNITLTVFDASGNAVYTRKAVVSVGVNRFSVDIKGLVNGSYKVAVQHGDEVKQAQLIFTK